MSEYVHFKFQIRDKAGLQFWLLEKDWKQVDHKTILSSQGERARAGLACYQNGEILCKYGEIKFLPPGVSFLIEPRANENPMRFDKKLVRNGEGGVLVKHTRSSSQTGDPRYYYATTIVNLSPNRVRVIKFAALGRGIFGIKSDPAKGYYSAEQFQNWYGVTDPEGWIAPNEEACDPDNYASGAGVWAYFFEDDLGTYFIATAPLINDCE